MLNQGCGTIVAQQVPETPTPAPTATPSSAPSPGSVPPMSGTTQLYSTPLPSPGAVTPPPIPTPTPAPGSSNAPVFVVRSGSTPPPITPAGQAAQAPEAVPSGSPTLAPGMVAVISDQFVGSVKQGKPGDAIGNVHILYSNGELVGDRAHFDGLRTVTMTGHPFLINRARDSVLSGDTIVFDTVDQTAVLSGGVGTSNQGVERGLVHFRAKELHTDPDGTGHGTNAFLSTCENPRGGYHMTGKKLTYYPGDKIVINNVILWLGAAAVFYLPRVVIPLRQVDDETKRPAFFPEMGYDQAEGFYVKAKLGFGKDQYYYGYYRVEYFTKVGLGLGYLGFYSKKNGRRSAQVNFYGIRDRRTLTSTYNLSVNEIENFSQTLRSNVSFSYNSAYGALTNLPTSTNLNGSITHTGLSTQTYTFGHVASGSQSDTNSFGLSDTRRLAKNIGQSEIFTLSHSTTSYGGVQNDTATAKFTSNTNMTTPGATYLLKIDKQFQQSPFGYNSLPELQIQPTAFLRNIGFPIRSTFTIGEYSEPQTREATSRADLNFTLGPVLYNLLGSSFSAGGTVRQIVYGTGDLKAQISQNLSLNTAIGTHFVNSLTYNEANYSGPSFVPFQFDAQSNTNTKGANDVMTFFNQDHYVLSINAGTSFKALAQPVGYTLSARPTARSIVIFSGSLNPGFGFSQTHMQLATPLGRDMTLQFIGDID
ncbi:MAG: hypothetical protein M3R30_06135, partial [Candidatus Eremiobacteraeota bacterium]|nr:hypothetical protein [Candidatus Eremiobacteraeota bacterium]